MATQKFLSQTAHRPYPLPSGPWILTQWWRDLLFAHWPVNPTAIAHLIPPALELDLIDGMAWVAIVPFRMTGIRARFTPPLPGLSQFPELNLRTYVRPRQGRVKDPGVYFWTLEASNPIAVLAARRLFHLPYRHARMQCVQRDGWIEYASHRTHSGEPPADFIARYRPTVPAKSSALLQWLTERYCLYTTNAASQLYQGQIHHRQWTLYEAEAIFNANTLAGASSIALSGMAPLLHFCREIEVAIWALHKLD